MDRRIFFYGQHFGESGPAIVNNNIVRHLPDDVARLHFRNKLLMRAECLLKIVWCQVVILSALGHRRYEICLAKLLKKKIVYIMHGFAQDDGPEVCRRETELLPMADKILCVSSLFCRLAKEKFPEYADRMDVLTNGISWEDFRGPQHCENKRNPNEIVLVGGGRLIKQNLNVCKAVQEINLEQNLNLHVNVYGKYVESDESPEIKKIPCVTFHGLIPHCELLLKYRQSGLFVQNSIVESFGLAVIEAIACGCDILAGEKTGATDIIGDLRKEDMIHDYADISEIKRKIGHVLKHPNNDRLINSIDKEKTSWQCTATKMIEYAKTI